MFNVNNDLKAEFLNTTNNSKKKQSLLKKLEPQELLLKKDVLQFSAEEIKESFKLLNLKTEISVSTTLSHLRSYFKWGVEEGYISNDPTTQLNREDIKEIINEKEANEQFLYIEDISKIKKALINSQDIAVLILIWNGISKDNKWYALRTILKKNINKANKSIRYFSYGKEQVIYLSEEDFNIIEDAANQSIYTSSSTNKKFELESTQFLFKVKPRKNKSSDIIGYNVIYERLSTALENLGYRNITFNNIQASAILYKMDQLEALTAPSVIKILEEFGLSSSPGNLNNYLKLYEQAYKK